MFCLEINLVKDVSFKIPKKKYNTHDEDKSIQTGL